MSNPTSTCTPASISQRIARLRNCGDAVNTAHSFRAGSTSSNIVPSPPTTEFSLPSLAVEPAQVSQAVYGVQQLIFDSGMGLERGHCPSAPVAPLGSDVSETALLPLGGVEIQGYRVEGDTELKGLDSVGRIPVYVMLPLDTVNADGVFRYGAAKWFRKALQVLVSSGVKGVAVDLWWGSVEVEPGNYDWTGYKQLFELVKSIGLKLQVVLAFHACGGNVGDVAQIPLPSWVLMAGEHDPDLFFADRPRDHGPGQRNREYVSIFADEVPGILFGRSPMQCYEDFMISFRNTFYSDLGPFITEIVVGAGPCGELRYPSYSETNGWRFPGIGEFQCYDRHALAALAKAAKSLGRPEWGNGGPHDSGTYNNTPEETEFFTASGSWNTPYGQFFLKWYSDSLLQHGERLLSISKRVFSSKLKQHQTQTFKEGCCTNTDTQFHASLEASSDVDDEKRSNMMDGVKSWVGKAGLIFKKQPSAASFTDFSGTSSSMSLSRGTDSYESVRQRVPSQGSLSTTLHSRQSMELLDVTAVPQEAIGGGMPYSEDTSFNCDGMPGASAPGLQVYSLNDSTGNSVSQEEHTTMARNEQSDSSHSNADDLASLSHPERLPYRMHPETISGNAPVIPSNKRISARNIFHRIVGFLGSPFTAGEEGVELCLKVAGLHWWYLTRSHAAELTAGYFNTDNYNGYEDIVGLCARHGANLTLTCVEMCDAQHPPNAQCSPQGLLRRIRKAAAAAGVELSGENALPIFIPSGCGVDKAALQRIVKNAHECPTADRERELSRMDGQCRQRNGGPDDEVYSGGLPPLQAFTFLRLGPEILNPYHQGLWMQFMQGMQS